MIAQLPYAFLNFGLWYEGLYQITDFVLYCIVNCNQLLSLQLITTWRFRWSHEHKTVDWKYQIV